MRMTIKDVRLAFPSLWKPYKGKGDQGDGKFGAKLILAKNHPGVKALNDAFAVLAKEKWNTKGDATLKMLIATDKTCLHNGDVKADWEGFEGNLYIGASSATRPTVFDQQRNDLTQADGKPYSGCYVDVSLEVWAQDNDYGKRINAQLRGVQFRRDGDAFAGGSSPAGADEFEDIGAAGEDDDGMSW